MVGVWIEPVIAQLIMISFAMVRFSLSPLPFRSLNLDACAALRSSRPAIVKDRPNAPIILLKSVTFQRWDRRLSRAVWRWEESGHICGRRPPRISTSQISREIHTSDKHGRRYRHSAHSPQDVLRERPRHQSAALARRALARLDRRRRWRHERLGGDAQRPKQSSPAHPAD